jgi:hypothetical protein
MRPNQLKGYDENDKQSIHFVTVAVDNSSKYSDWSFLL